jgi:hypothetical protein
LATTEKQVVRSFPQSAKQLASNRGVLACQLTFADCAETATF